MGLNPLTSEAQPSEADFTINYSYLFGGEQDDDLGGFKIDTNGNMYLLSSYYNSSWADILLTKFSAADGSIVWSKKWGTSDEDDLKEPGENGITSGGASNNNLAIDSNGDIYFTAAVKDTNGVYVTAVVKVNASGVVQWEKFWIPENVTTASREAIPYALDVANGKVFVTGSSQNKVFLLVLSTTDGSLQAGTKRGFDASVGYNDRGYAIKATSDGQTIYIAGWEGKNNKGILYKFTNEGANFAWYKKIAVPYGSRINDLDLDANGNVYLSCDIHGSTNYIEFLKINSDSSFAWAKRYNASNSDRNNTSFVRIDNDKLYVGGRLGIDIQEAWYDNYGDGFFMQLDLNGNSLKQYYFFTGTETMAASDWVKTIEFYNNKLYLAGNIYPKAENYAGSWFEAPGTLTDVTASELVITNFSTLDIDEDDGLFAAITPTMGDFDRYVKEDMHDAHVTGNTQNYIQCIDMSTGKDGAYLSNLALNDTTIDGFTPSQLHYTVDLDYGSTNAKTVTATAYNASANVSITQAGNIYGTETERMASVVVTDGSVTKTYTVLFNVLPNSTPALSTMQENWAKLFGGEQDDDLGGMVADNNGNLFVASSYYNSSWSDIVLAKFNSTTGEVIWSKKIDGGFEDAFLAPGENGITAGGASSRCIATDGTDIYITAATKDAVSAFYSVYVAKISGYDGSAIWQKTWNHEDVATAQAEAYPYALDIESGNVYVTGSSPGGVFLLVMDAANGNIKTETKRNIDASDGYEDKGYAVKATSSGTVYIAGWEGKNNKGILYRFNNSGADFAWYERIALDYGSRINDLDFDTNGNIYLSCDVHGVSTYLEVLKLDADGNYIWGKKFNQTDDRNNTSCVRVIDDSLYVGGRVEYTHKDSSYDPEYGDGVILKMDLNGNLVSNHYFFTGKNTYAAADWVKSFVQINNKLFVAGTIYPKEETYSGTWLKGYGNAEDVLWGGPEITKHTSLTIDDNDGNELSRTLTVSDYSRYVNEDVASGTHTFGNAQIHVFSLNENVFDGARLRKLLVSNEDIAGFNSGKTDYSYWLEYGTTQVPEVKAYAVDTSATVEITNATFLNGTQSERTTTVKVTSADGTTTRTYTVVFKIAPNTIPEASNFNMAFGKMLGDTEDDDNGGMVMDNSGNIYMVSSYYNSSWSDIIVYSANSSDGSIRWAKKIKGNFEDDLPEPGENGITAGGASSRAIASDGTDIYICGETKDATTAYSAVFVVKLSGTDGATIWEKFWQPDNSGTATSEALAYALDVQNGKVFVTGSVQGGIFLLSLDASNGNISTTSLKNVDASPTYEDKGYSVKASSDGLTVYVAGWEGENNKGILYKFSGGGTTLDWLERIGIDYGSRINDIDLDANGNIYLSCDIHGVHTYLEFLKLDSNGNYIWGRKLNKTSDLNNTSMVRVMGDTLYVGGRIGLNLDNQNYDLEFGDGVILQTDLNGNLIRGDYYATGSQSSAAADWIKGVAIYNGNLYMAGTIYPKSSNYKGSWYKLPVDLSDLDYNGPILEKETSANVDNSTGFEPTRSFTYSDYTSYTLKDLETATATNKKAQIYYFKMGVSLSSDANLKNLMVGEGTLEPAFDSTTLAYTVSLAAGTTQTPTVWAEANNSNASVQVTDATDVTSATEADRTTTIVVTAEDGTTTKTYSIVFNVESAANNDATLASLTVSQGTLSPAFSADVLNYTVSLPSGTTATPSVTATPANSNASVQVTDATDVTSATEADRTTTIVVTAEDGTTTKTYSIVFNVESAANNDATLASLTVSQGTLSPAFSADVLNYTVSLPSGTTATPSVTATPANSNASVQVTDATDVTSTTESDRTTTIVVTAEDGTTTKTYSIVFNVETTGISEKLLQQLKVYPVPAENILYIDAQSIDYKIENILILDMNGKDMKVSHSLDTNVYKFNISNLKKGTYIIRIKTDKYWLSQPVIKN